MEQTVQKLTDLIKAITEKFPDENDLKGFSGISRALILESLNECNGLLTTLNEHNNHFEVILLKRESAEVFEKLFSELDEKFEDIKAEKFNYILKLISKLRSIIRETYAAVINTVPIRTEAEIAKVKEELALLISNNEQLKKINQELLDTKSVTVKNTSDLITEATTLRDNVRSLKDEVEVMKISSTTIIADFQEKQRIAIENEGKITTFLATIVEI
jgi:vacuolar-type H+-ATPase subunit I/STV1